MKIDGRAIAEEILSDLRLRVAKLKERGITPHLVVILVGDDPSSQAYVAQKQIKSRVIGTDITILQYPNTISQDELLFKVAELNTDPNVHGIIIQRPLPYPTEKEKIINAPVKEKDIDGFRTNTLFDPPIAEAVYTIIAYAHDHIAPTVPLFPWPDDIKVVLLGKGETAGTPVHKVLVKLGIDHTMIDSKTENVKTVLKRADIVISAVGKREVIKPEDLKQGVILISIGMHKEEDNKLHGDYEDEQIKDIASYYTPTPGGVGPVNVAMLLRNLVEAAETNTMIDTL